MKIVVIADTHGQHSKLHIPKADCIIHCGDISSMGTMAQIGQFMNWFVNLQAPTKIFVAGNHDFLLENDYGVEFINEWIRERTGIIYLQDETFIYNGIKIYGSPMSPRFGNWAFMAERGNDIKEYWDKIPDDTDILITHSPPHGILDKTSDGINAGCEELLKVVNRIKPKYHLFGHIHEGYGQRLTDETLFINASVVDEHYQLKNRPCSIEIKTEVVF